MKHIVILCCLLLFPALACADSFTVDWNRGIVTATATGIDNPKSPDGPEYSSARAARRIAQALLLEAVQGVHVTSEQTVGQVPAIKTRMQGIVRNIQSISEPTFRKVGDRTEATVTATMCLHNDGVESCRKVDSVKTVADAVIPPKPVSLEAKRCNPSLKDVQGNFDEKAKVLLIAIDSGQGYVPSLNTFPLVVRYTLDGQICSFISPATLDAAPAAELEKNGSRRMFQNSNLALKEEDNPFIMRNAVKVEKQDSMSVIYLSEQDGAFLQFLDEKLNKPFSRQGRIGLVINNAVTTVNK